MTDRAPSASAVVLLLAAFFTACGGSTPPPQPQTPKAAAPEGSDTSRPLTKSECASLGQQIVDACNGRGNERSSGLEGWCTDMVQGNSENGNWVDTDCLKHFKYMDAYCFQSAANAHGMMDCDRTVDRSQ